MGFSKKAQGEVRIHLFGPKKGMFNEILNLRRFPTVNLKPE
jgi:hypothetical protein